MLSSVTMKPRLRHLAIAALVVLPAAVFLLSVSHAQQKFPVISTVDEPTIAGRPVAVDATGKLLPWPMPEDTGYSYSSHFLSQWAILWDQYNRQRLPYYYCCFDFDRTTYELIPDKNWVNSTGYLRAMMQGFVERLYPYTGDPHTLEFLQNFVDYELENGTTPMDYAWAGVPYPSANPGEAKYSGWSAHGEDFVEPHVVGEDGYAYLRLYEMTGNTRYLEAAIRCANALVKNYKPGDATNSPWAFRCLAKTGALSPGKGMSPYSANVVEPIMLFDELLRLHRGDAAGYAKVRAGAWDWLMKYPMRNNVWVGYFEDVGPNMENMNQVIPLEFARYVLLHPEKDPQWREHAKQLIEWVKATPRWPKYVVHGATVTTEQGSGKEFCCNQPNQCCDSHTSRLAAVEAFYYAKTGDEAYKNEAYRSFNWVTYFQGLPGGAHAPFSSQWWFTDEFSDGPRRLMDAFWAVPEWAPKEESHLLGGMSPVTKIEYRRGEVTYTTFDAEGSEVLRLDFAPERVAVGGRTIGETSDPKVEGYAYDAATGVLRVHHVHSGQVDIRGRGGKAVPTIVTFDDPHLAAGSALHGDYPNAYISWSIGEWRIAAPGGKFGTFHLSLVPDGVEGEFSFLGPRVFDGIDVANIGVVEAMVTLDSPEAPAVKVKLAPGELKRVRTGWSRAISRVRVTTSRAGALQFDNLAFHLE